MPTYEYQCDACDQRFEAQQRMTDPAIEECPDCGESEVRRLISASAFHLKGSGWYATDYKNTGSAAGSD